MEKMTELLPEASPCSTDICELPAELILGKRGRGEVRLTAFFKSLSNRSRGPKCQRILVIRNSA